MKYIKFLAVGFIFGIVLTKAEAVSWYRIYEMFHFQSFHMFGIIGVGVCTGLIGLQLFKKFNVNDLQGNPIVMPDKEAGITRYLVGGLLFGLGWGLVGTCPAPIFILLGTGAVGVLIILFGALLGTFLYGLIKDKLPH